MKATLPAALILTLAATAVAQERQKAEAVWKEGKVTIDYDAPPWRAEFGEAMTKQATWRLGKNDPTRVTLTCGLMTDKGCIPAGNYGMAMQKNDQGKWDLVVYPGTGHFQEGRTGWSIKPSTAKDGSKPSDELTLKLSDNQELEVRFGPHMSVYRLKPVAMLPPVKAEFAGIDTAIEVMAVPCGDKVDKLGIGTASISRGDVKIAWNMALSIDGDKATLAFHNQRAGAIADEMKQVEATIERVKGMLDGAEEARAKRLQEFLAGQEKTMKQLEAEAAANERFKPENTVSGEVSQRDAKAATLAFESKRIEGGMVLTFGAGDKTATFTVKPSEFRVPRQRR